MQSQQKVQSSQLWELLRNGDYDYATPRANAVREAIILQKGSGDFIVDIGAKRDAIIPARDLQQVPQERIDALNVGDTVPVVVMRRGAATNDLIPVSFSQGLQQEDWFRAKDMVDTGEVVECEVVEANRGGVVVRFGRVRGFVPNSHLGSFPGGRQTDLDGLKESLIGSTMHLAVIDVNPQRRRLVLSRRAADRQRRKELLHELEVGQVYKGIVQNIVDFGAFVDIGGIDGLVHISEIAWEHVEHPSDVLSLGQEIEVTVLNVDIDRQRVGLSRKRLLPDPWDVVTADLAIGDSVYGQVTHIVDFGFFVDVGKGVEGLVHETQVPGSGGAGAPEIAVGDQVRVQILFVDDDKHQLSLSLLEALPSGKPADEGQPAEDNLEPADNAASDDKAGDAESETEGVLLY